MLKRLLVGLAAWQACLVAAAAVTVLMGSEVDASVLVPTALAGVAVAVLVTLSVSVRRLTRTTAAISGFAIGLLPTIAGTIYGWFFLPKTIDATAGWIALSLWLAPPSALGGALCGVFSSRNQQRAR